MPLRLSNSTIDADDTTLSLSANCNDITSLTHSLMYFRRKDQSIACYYAKRLQQKLNVEKANFQLRLNATRPTNIEHYKLLGLIIDKDLNRRAQSMKIDHRKPIIIINRIDKNRFSPIDENRCSQWFLSITVNLEVTLRISSRKRGSECHWNV